MRNRTGIAAAIAAFFLGFGCSTQTAVTHGDNDTREIVRETKAITEAPPAPEPPPPETATPAIQTGTLAQQTPCVRLLPDKTLFTQKDAQKAWELYSSGKYAAAADAIQKAIAANKDFDVPAVQQAYFLAGLSFSKTGKPEDKAKAVDYMKKAFESKASLSRIAAVYGTKMSYDAGRWQDTVDFADALLNNDDYRTYHAIALANLGRFDAAVSEFDSIEKYPKEIRLQALDARARAQSETSQQKAALETYRRIYELDPKSPQAQIAQDAIMAQKDSWPKGFVFPRPTQKADKAKSEREQAAAHFNAHRSEQAITAYTKLLKADKARKATPDICDDLYAIARSHVKLRQHTKSIPFFKEALTTCKNTDLHIKILYTAAKAAWNAGQNDTAIAWYQQIVDEYPQHSYADDAYNYEALILSGMGKADEAREVLQKQIKAYPDGDMAKDAYWALLQDLYERGKYTEAVQFVKDNIDHAGENDLYSQGRLRYFQARSCEHIKDTACATSNYLTVLEEYPLSYYAMLSLGRLGAIDPGQAKSWIDTYRTQVYTTESAQNYCFIAASTDQRFDAVQRLTKMSLYTDALDELTPLVESPDKNTSFEAKLARAMILQMQQRHSDSARLAASLLNPQHDLPYQAYAAWTLAYPMPWRPIVEKATPKGSDLFYTTYAIMREESYYNPKAESWANARGLMQVMLPTAQSTAADIGLKKPTAADLFVPETAIPIGSAYIAKLMKILIPHPMFVLPGYNAGQGNVGKWIDRFADDTVDLYVEKIPFKEARHYAKRVGTTLWRYRWLYDTNMPTLFDPAIRLKDLPRNK